LIEFFFEKRYCQNNKPNSIGFPQKIIVIEDIDAQGDVVLDRSKKNNVISSSVNHINMIDVVQSIIMNENEKEKGKGRGKENDNDNDREKEKGRNKERGIDNNQLMLLKPVEDDLITLDDILNLWDGLEENSGRILVISSNHYNDLDPALTRPGRIDITIEMNNASHEIITEMYNHLYETTTIDTEMLKKVTPMFYSPAEIINIYLMYKNEPDKFMQRLILNTKIG
jgi:SpoVK/Ycf46/Vps4 family AAA+-type ATPase